MRQWSFDIAEVRQVMSDPPDSNEQSSRNHSPSESWDEGLGFDGAKDALLKGVRRQRLRKLATRIKNKLSLRQQETRQEMLSRKGEVLDTERYRQGRPRATWEDKTATEVQPAVAIDVNTASLSGVSSDVWLQRGAAVLALVREARRQGIPTELYASGFSDSCFGGWAGEGYDGPSLIRVRLKRAGESISQKIINFALAHSAFFRRVIFCLREEVAVREGWDVQSGYGSTIYDEEPDTSSDLWIPAWRETKEPEEVIQTAMGWTSAIKS